MVQAIRQLAHLPHWDQDILKKFNQLIKNNKKSFNNFN
jgi:hypothetical protein